MSYEDIVKNRSTHVARQVPAAPPQTANPVEQQPTAPGIVKNRKIEYVPPTKQVESPTVQPPEQPEPNAGISIVPVNPIEYENQQLKEELAALKASQQAQITVQQPVTQPTAQAQVQAPAFDEATKQQLDELAEIKRQQRIKSMIDPNALENVDPAIAAELTDKVIAPIVNESLQIAEAAQRESQLLREEIAAIRQQQALQPKEFQKQIQRDNVDRSILNAHPDFVGIKDSPEFKQFSAGKISNSSITVGQMLSHEYHNGNTDFVIDIINQFKQGQPSLQNIASVPMSANGVHQPVPQAEPARQYSPTFLKDLRYAYAARDITHEEYTRQLAEYRQANQQQ